MPDDESMVEKRRDCEQWGCCFQLVAVLHDNAAPEAEEKECDSGSLPSSSCEACEAAAEQQALLVLVVEGAEARLVLRASLKDDRNMVIVFDLFCFVVSAGSKIVSSKQSGADTVQ